MAECPACRQVLAEETFGGITVDGCHSCGGVWFDRDELTRMARGDLGQLEAIDRAFEAAAGTAPPDGASGPCPRCGAGVITFEPPQTPGLSLLACAAGHGVWLREDDFEAIVARVAAWRAQRRGTATAAPSDSRRRLRDVARVLLARPCDRCRQPNAAASPICWACGAALRSVDGLFVCPACSGHLDGVVDDHVVVNQWDACGGLWLDRRELGALIHRDRDFLAKLQARAQAVASAEVATSREDLPCPACPGALRAREYAPGSGVFLSTCGQCGGVWLDPSALLPIQQLVQRDQRHQAPQ